MLDDRFWEKVDKDPMIPGGCWLWTAGLSRGYGSFMVGSRTDDTNRTVRAHCLSYETLTGTVPPGLELDHRCRVKSCVRPSHLEPVTHQENCARGDNGKVNRAKKRCTRGHPYSGDNLYVSPRGSRECRTCRRFIGIRSRERTKA